MYKNYFDSSFFDNYAIMNFGVIKMEWTTSYTISQILTVFVYICLIISYYVSPRIKILNVNILSHILQAIAFALLGGISGVAMSIIYIGRDTYFAHEEVNNSDSHINNKDIAILIVLFIIIIVSAILTYKGLLSILSVLATVISTIAIWQKSPLIYKLLGIPCSFAWLGYHIYLNSIIAIILESILFVTTFIGFIIEYKKKSELNKTLKLNKINS